MFTSCGSTLYQILLSLRKFMSNTVKCFSLLSLCKCQQISNKWCYRIPSSKSSQLRDDPETIMLWYPEKGDVSVNISESAGG